ncbi:MAG: L-Ala-D/L-Glu epimerase [Candidatus Celerinatantimonas neptuna]|nr:MAG: L-Ala-D/L-Glu epimerase [Candidatus Celerinatantimonas neptuna]
MRQIEIETVKLPLSRPFRIARGTRQSVDVIRVMIEENGFIGWGECTPTAHYGQSPASVSEQIRSILPQLRQGMTRQELQLHLSRGSARNVLDCALWRLEGGRRHQSLWAVTEVVQPATICCAQTLSLASLSQMVDAAVEAINQGAQLLKIKLNDESVVEKVSAIRSVSQQTQLIIDANESWAGLDLPALMDELAVFDITMIEQPLPAGQDNCLKHFTHPIPVCADESCHDAGDIAPLSDRYEMINIKLDKCGGLTEALAMVEIAHRYQMDVMTGCMLGSSLAMEAALPIAAQSVFVDLDGPIWLAGDSAPYLVYRNGCIET